MDCNAFRELMSARLDGECGDADSEALARHLAGCAACRAFDAELTALHRAVRVRAAEPVPDLSAAILARAHPPQPGRFEWVRWALLIVALTELALALPGLVLGEDTGATVHVARHIGSLSIAMAVGMAYAAWHPERAYGFLPVGAALAACTLVTAVLDVADGRAGAFGESHHVLELLALGLLWKLAGSPRPGSRARAPRRPALA